MPEADELALLRAQVAEAERLGDAARAALCEEKGRWRRELGAAAQERIKLRSCSSIVAGQGKLPSCIAVGPTPSEYSNGTSLAIIMYSTTPHDHTSAAWRSNSAFFAWISGAV